ncbi:hypothetical protein CONPUDRAFT_169449 [Coniophora puteana RWD-64-598 SS2]|uniref:Uncharacterized protein n=1 Tax=Coniophora puteana (strain RWD-64-598) TaxID=741705 RepID=A0A5M3M917_CONPW|nr:uncharacterized protein CONPUDRAFT_169449 [Coniophora puteana RWD-64-598 SS2]EIW75698.1 hypothetical protein CONPUDRAFT_169449 [Coniophora puteana RWD-64-598 SS2]
MRSFITLAVLYATLVAAAPLPPQVDGLVGNVEPVLDSLNARQLDGILGDLPIPIPAPPAAPAPISDLDLRQLGGVTGELPIQLPALPERQLGKVTGAASGLEQEIDELAASAGIKARQDLPLPLLELPIPMPALPIPMPELPIPLPKLPVPSPGLGKRQLDDVTGDLPISLPAPPALPVSIPGLGERQLGNIGTALGSLSDLDSMLQDLGLDETADKAAAGADAKLARRQDDEGLEGIVDNIIDVLRKRQGPTADVLGDIDSLVSEAADVVPLAPLKRQDGVSGLLSAVKDTLGI